MNGALARYVPVLLVIAGIIALGYPLALAFGLPLAQRDREDIRKWLREETTAPPAPFLTADGADFGDATGVIIRDGAPAPAGAPAVVWGEDAVQQDGPVWAAGEGELYADDGTAFRLLTGGTSPSALPPDGSRLRFTFGAADGPILLNDRLLIEDQDYVLSGAAAEFSVAPPLNSVLRRVSGDYGRLADGLVVMHQYTDTGAGVRVAESVQRLAPLLEGETDGTNREFAFPADQLIEADRTRQVFLDGQLLSDAAERPAERVDGEARTFTFASDHGLVVLDGKLQEEETDFRRSGTEVTFSTTPARNAQLRNYPDYWLNDPAGGGILMALPPPEGSRLYTTGFMRYSRPACGETLMDCFHALPQHPVPFPHWIAERTVPFLTRYPVTDQRNVLRATLYTSSGTLAALALGGVTGLLLALLFVAFRPLERTLLPWTIASQTVPIIALVPVLLLVLGNMGITIQTSLLPTALVGAYLCFFPVAVSTTKGLRAVEPLVLDLMKSYAAPPLAVLLKVRLAAATPYLFTGLKLGMAAALVGALVSETESNNRRGLGYQILGQVQSGNVADVWILLLLSAVLGIVLVGLVGVAQRLLAPWERRT